MVLFHILPFLNPTIATPQEVERNRIVAAPVSSPLRRFDEATGWIKSGDEWTSSDRKIGGSGSEGEWSLGLHEFRFLEWRTVEHSGRKFPVLTIVQTTGGYIYPVIRRDWVTVPKATVLIFEKFPFIDPAKLEFGKTLSIEVDSLRWTGYDLLALNADRSATPEAQIQEIIGKSIVRSAEPDFKHRFKMLVFPVEHEGKRKVRFLFEAFNIKERNSVVERTKRQLSPNAYLSLNPRALNSYYYETSFESFRDFFAPFSIEDRLKERGTEGNHPTLREASGSSGNAEGAARTF